MIRVTIKFLGHLIRITGSASVDLEMETGSNIKDLLDKIFNIYGPEMRSLVMGERGESLAPYYKILINGRNFKLINGFNTPLEMEQVIHIMPPIAGG